jgi:hypothetical protein
VKEIIAHIRKKLTKKKEKIIFGSGMGKNNIYESNDLFKYEKIAFQG